jgi:sulfate/thiosulfate transport system substrate-binding protein
MGKGELRLGVTIAVLASLALPLAACGGKAGETAGGPAGKELYVVGYPGLDSVYRDALEPAFEKTRAGSGVTFHNSFGPSGAQSRAVAGGQPASIVNLEQTGEMERLVEAGVVDANWEKGTFFGGIAHWTVIVFVVRDGNPKGIHSVSDLLRDDVDVVIPNPLRSDAGRWSVMDVYATLIHARKSETEALAGVGRLLQNAVSQPESSAEAMAAFLEGQGDVLLAYESQAIQAAAAGRDLGFVVPNQTIRVDIPIATTSAAPPAARHFLAFLLSGTGQRLWARAGYRPADQMFQARFKERFPFRETLTIRRFGGWARVNNEFFDPATGSVATIERELGVSTSD